MNLPSNQQLITLAACSMLFLTGFTKPSDGSLPEANALLSQTSTSANPSTPTKRGFSFEYKGLFYLKLSLQAGKGSEGFQLDIQTNDASRP